MTGPGPGPGPELPDSQLDLAHCTSLERGYDTPIAIHNTKTARKLLGTSIHLEEFAEAVSMFMHVIIDMHYNTRLRST